MKELEKIKADISKDPVSIQSEQLNVDFDYELTGSYVGKIVNNNDPSKRGACKIRVYGIFGVQIQDDDLPWAFPLQNFIGSNAGSFIVPTIGTIVRVIFRDGDIYQPQYDCKELDESKLPSSRLEDYPNTLVLFETDKKDSLTINTVKNITKFKHNSGNSLTFDKSEIEVKHKSGAHIKIDSSGNLDIYGVKVSEKHDVHFKSSAKVVKPNTDFTGCFCAIPVCPITGLSQVGDTAI